MSSTILVLDANIIIRAVLGNKVRDLLVAYHETVDFFTPNICLEDAKKYLPVIFEKRKLPSEAAIEALSNLECLLQIVEKYL